MAELKPIEDKNANDDQRTAINDPINIPDSNCVSFILTLPQI